MRIWILKNRCAWQPKTRSSFLAVHKSIILNFNWKISIKRVRREPRWKGVEMSQNTGRERVRHRRLATKLLKLRRQADQQSCRKEFGSRENWWRSAGTQSMLQIKAIMARNKWSKVVRQNCSNLELKPFYLQKNLSPKAIKMPKIEIGKNWHLTPYKM